MIKWFIDKKSRMPLFLQIKDLTKYFISTGAIRDGDRLPGVVELADELKINFETVRKAYKELEREQLVAMRPGRGTVATLHKDALGKLKGPSQGKPEAPLRPEALIQRDVVGLLQEGRTVEEIRALVESILSGVAIDRSRKYVIFTECNLPQIREISQTLAQAAGIRVKPVLVSDLREELVAAAGEAELLGIVTTGFHVNEVADIVGDLAIEVNTLITNMSPDTLAKISSYDKSSRFGFISRDQESVPLYRELLRSVFGRKINIRTSVYSDTEKARAVLEASDVLLATPPVFEDVKKLAAGRIPVFCTFDRVDPQSLKLVKAALLKKLSCP
ncbi:MAG TPA: GntR family transcriptional regulator [Candidatus Aminicenantes bacterium]|nr:GntR family transcriptional regulator [Candidatus Aminicenantes bacterium]